MAVTDIRNEKDQAIDKAVSKKLEKKCSKCYVSIRDVKLLKAHFWGVHIRKEDQLQAIEVLKTNEPFKLNALHSSSPAHSSSASSCSIDSNSGSCFTPTSDKSKNMKKCKRLNGKLTTSPKSKCCKAKNSTETTPKIEFYPCDLVVLNSLKLDELKYFNLLNNELDEAKIAQRAKILFSNEPYNKINELKPGAIAWAKWNRKGSTLKWPCIIDKIQENKSKRNTRVHFKYYEYSQDVIVGHVFTSDSSDIELFFGNSENHFENKISTCTHPKTTGKYEFFYTYTNALKDFVKNLEICEKEKKENRTIFDLANETNEPLELEPQKSIKKITADNYLIGTDLLSLDEVRKLAYKEDSSELIELNKMRKQLSKEILNSVLTQECKEHLINIMNIKSHRKAAYSKPHLIRHIDYISGTDKERRAMELKSTGPVIHEDALHICQHLQKLTGKYFVNKPEFIKNYETDILYYEAIVWSLMKLKKTSRAKAAKEFKYNIFNSTPEEKKRTQCKHIINKLNSGKNESSISMESITISSVLTPDEDMHHLFEYDIQIDTTQSQPMAIQHDEPQLNDLQSEISRLLDSMVNVIEAENL